VARGDMERDLRLALEKCEQMLARLRAPRPASGGARDRDAVRVDEKTEQLLEDLSPRARLLPPLAVAEVDRSRRALVLSLENARRAAAERSTLEGAELASGAEQTTRGGQCGRGTPSLRADDRWLRARRAKWPGATRRRSGGAPAPGRFLPSREARSISATARRTGLRVPRPTPVVRLQPPRLNPPCRLLVAVRLIRDTTAGDAPGDGTKSERGPVHGSPSRARAGWCRPFMGRSLLPTNEGGAPQTGWVAGGRSPRPGPGGAPSKARAVLSSP